MSCNPSTTLWQHGHLHRNRPERCMWQLRHKRGRKSSSYDLGDHSVNHSMCSQVRLTLSPPMQLRWHSSHASRTFQSPHPPASNQRCPWMTMSTFFIFKKDQHNSLSAHTCTGVSTCVMFRIENICLRTKWHLYVGRTRVEMMEDEASNSWCPFYWLEKALGVNTLLMLSKEFWRVSLGLTGCRDCSCSVQCVECEMIKIKLWEKHW